jgi:hypothetical protein
LGGEIRESRNGTAQVTGKQCVYIIFIVVHEIFHSFSFIRPNMKQLKVNLSFRLRQLRLLVQVLFIIYLSTS